MASSSSSDLPSAATRNANFEQAVALSLHLWPALSLAVQNNWGGPDSADKRDWFAGAIVDLFPPFVDGRPPPPANANSTAAAAAAADDEPDQHDVETVLLQVMLDEFEVNVDDDSAFETAERICLLRGQCARGQSGELDALRRQWAARKGTKVEGLFKRAQDPDQEAEWEDDDEDSGSYDDDEEGEQEDIDMDEAPPLVPVPRERPAPEVDDEGFTKVSRKKR